MVNAEKRRYWKNREEQIMKIANEGMKRETIHLKTIVAYNEKKERK